MTKKFSRLLQLDTAVSSGFNVPETLISKNIGEIKRFVSKNGKIAVKPIHVRVLMMINFGHLILLRLSIKKNCLKLMQKSYLNLQLYSKIH